MTESKQSVSEFLTQVRQCTVCLPHLPLGVNPVLQVNSKARILIAGQAPGQKVHNTGIAFQDASGDRLRQWMGIDSSVFYDAESIAILPMGFCYPGKGQSGDLPPRPECAEHWRQQLLEIMPDIQLTLLIGQYAQNWHLGMHKEATLTATVKAWRDYWPNCLPLPHPSPRNNIWLSRHPWFNQEIIPALQSRVQIILNESNR